MICKWCGETIGTTAARCPKCGRETPAMSDCGGFYKLKAGGDNSGAAPQTGGPIKLPQLDKLTHMYVRDLKQTRLLQLVGLAAMLVTVVLLVVVLISIGGVGAQLRAEEPDGEGQIQHQEEPENSEDSQQNEAGDDTPGETQAEDPTDTQPVTDPETPPAVLAEQDVVIDVKLFKRTDGDVFAAAELVLDGYGDDALVWVHTERSGKTHDNEIVCDLNNGGDCLTLLQHDAYAEEVLTASLSWDAQGEYFSALELENSTWEYRFGDEKWKELETGAATNEAGKSALTLKKSEIKTLLEGKSNAELRCIITFKHPGGGTLTITLDGLLFDEDGVVSNGATPFEKAPVPEEPKPGVSSSGT